MRNLVLAVLVVVAAPVHAQEAAPPSASSAVDADLVAALVTLFDPFVPASERGRGFESPALRDPRAIAPLVFLLADADPRMRTAAARALGAFAADPRVERALLLKLGSRYEDVNVRIAAVESLAPHGGPAVGEALFAVFTNTDEPPMLRDAVRRVLDARYPELARRSTAAAVDRSGRNLLTAGSAVLGSFALASVGALG